MKLMNDFDIV